MEDILKKVDTQKHVIYTIHIKLDKSPMCAGFKEGEASQNEEGEDLDSVSQVRRTIKYSTPFDNKKIIKSIAVSDDIIDEDGSISRNIELEYYLLVDIDEDEDFSLVEFHDVLEEEWREESSKCEININPYNEA